MGMAEPRRRFICIDRAPRPPQLSMTPSRTRTHGGAESGQVLPGVEFGLWLGDVCTQRRREGYDA